MTAAPETSTSTSDPVYARADMAARSGLDLGFIDRLCALGILTPSDDDRFTEGDVRRARILHALDSTGLPLDSVAEAIRAGQIDLRFVDDPAYSLFAGLTDETFGDASQRTGVPVEVLFAIREAMGSPQPVADDRLRELETGVVPAVELMVRHGVRPAVIERAPSARSAKTCAEWQRSSPTGG